MQGWNHIQNAIDPWNISIRVVCNAIQLQQKINTNELVRSKVKTKSQLKGKSTFIYTRLDACTIMYLKLIMLVDHVHQTNGGLWA